MNGKFILLLVICLNLVSIMISIGCQTSGFEACSGLAENNIVLSQFIATDINQSNYDKVQGIELDSNFSQEVEDLGTQQTSGILGTTAELIGSFIDGIGQVLGFLAFLTPLPIIAFFTSLQFPLWLVSFIAAPLIVLYIVAIIEFIRGSGF